ncbi:hypothetical protein KKF84_10000 [Myxococcota bacterium]|nr:hypothetical protein [Myxococcota bacterium]
MLWKTSKNPGVYCTCCTDENGALQSYDDRLKRMAQLLRHEDPRLGDNDSIARAKVYMSTMPAWKDHV